MCLAVARQQIHMRPIPQWIIGLGVVLLAASIHGRSQKPSSGVSKPQISQTSAGRFVDATERLGVHFKEESPSTSKKYLLETMGSGVALFDYDNDGRLDIFFSNGARIDDEEFSVLWCAATARRNQDMLRFLAPRRPPDRSSIDCATVRALW